MKFEIRKFGHGAGDKFGIELSMFDMEARIKHTIEFFLSYEEQKIDDLVINLYPVLDIFSDSISSRLKSVEFK